LLIEKDEKLIGLGLLFSNEKKRHIIVNSQSLHLNNTGNEYYDHITIEHNGFLIADKYKDEVLKKIFCEVLTEKSNYNELHIGAVEESNPLLNTKYWQNTNLNFRYQNRKKFHFVDIEKIRSEKEKYIENLSKNTRYQIRRSIKQFEKVFGPIEIQEAWSMGEANKFYDGLKVLHQEHWISKGKPGVFSNTYLDKFHSYMIEERFKHGEIQLLKISAGEHIVGYLYNFVYNKHVYYYQSGLKYEKSNKFKPGLISHFMAIEHNINIENNIYDFLMGTSQYKNSLSYESGYLSWIVVQKEQFALIIENSIKQVKRVLQKNSIFITKSK